MKQTVVILICSCFIWGVVRGQVWAESQLQLITGELPPYSYIADGQRQGVATEIVRELSSRVGHNGGIDMFPWARTIYESTRGLRLSYPLARLPYREDQYQWIGPIMSDQLIFFVREEDAGKYPDMESLKPLRIGVNRGAPSEQRLHDLGFPNVHSVFSERKNARMLLHGRFDAWYTTKLMMKYTLELLCEAKGQARAVYADVDIDMYLVASKEVEQERVQVWQDQLDAMKADGTYKMILDKYGILEEQAGEQSQAEAGNDL